MGKKFKKSRNHYKVENLPAEIKEEVDRMLATKCTYADVERFLIKEGHKIATSSICRYAKDKDKTLERILQVQEEAKVLADVIKNSKDEDYTEAGIQIIIAELTRKMADSKEDIEKMHITDATKLLNNLARTKSLKRKAESEIKNKKELALEEFEEEILKEIANDPKLRNDFYNILKRIKGK